MFAAKHIEVISTRPVCKNALCGFRSAHSVSEFLRLIVITSKNFRSIGKLEVPHLDPPIFFVRGFICDGFRVLK
jgi:hypothetical protein